MSRCVEILLSTCDSWLAISKDVVHVGVILRAFYGTAPRSQESELVANGEIR